MAIACSLGRTKGYRGPAGGAGQVTGHEPGPRELLLRVCTQSRVLRRFRRRLVEHLLRHRPGTLVMVDRSQPDEQRRVGGTGRTGTECGLDQLPAARDVSSTEVIVGGAHGSFT